MSDKSAATEKDNLVENEFCPKCKAPLYEDTAECGFDIYRVLFCDECKNYMRTLEKIGSVGIESNQAGPVPNHWS